MTLRSAPLLSKSLLLLVLADNLPPAEVGLYGIFTAVVLLNVLLIGGEYYTYSQREYFSSEGHDKTFVLQHQLIALVLIYLFTIPLQTFFIIFEIIPTEMFILYIIVLISEHITQEQIRILTSFNRATAASCVWFARSGIWPMVAIPFAAGLMGPTSIFNIIAIWAIFASLSACLACFLIAKGLANYHLYAVNWIWIKKGFKIGLIYLLASLGFRLLITLDRYVIQRSGEDAILGVYTVYCGLMIGVLGLVEAGAVNLTYPRMVAAIKRGHISEALRLARLMTLLALAIAVSSAIAILMLADPISGMAKFEIYKENISILYFLLTIPVVHCCSLVPHYYLYSSGGDRWIVLSHMSAVGVFAFLCWMLQQEPILWAVSGAVFGAFVWISFTKALTTCIYVSRKRA